MVKEEVEVEDELCELFEVESEFKHYLLCSLSFSDACPFDL